MFLTLNNVRKEFNGKVAVDNLSLEVPRGVIYGIIGPNGAGKTTTIRMIMDITRPDSGEILIEERTRTADFKNRVGYLPEERGLYKKMTLREIIIYMAELKGCPPSHTRSRIEPWLKRVDLQDYANKKVEELSKGMQQKLQFITTVIHEPDLIILDELFSGLDPLNIELVKNILMDLKRDGATILFSTHVMEQAEKLSDYICMISGGHKVIDGKLSEVKARFGTNTIQVVIEGEGSFIGGLTGVESMTEFNNYIELQVADGIDTNKLLQAMVEKVRIRRFDIVVPSLYSIFIKTARVNPADFKVEPGASS